MWTGFRRGRASEIAVRVSSRLAEPYRADLVRIIHGDANPAGHGLKFEEVEARFEASKPLNRAIAVGTPITGRPPHR
jgi:hypothetical protein